MNIYCIVVTYNRLALLKENIEALKSQSYPLDKIIIVNNHSDDGTAEFLDQYSSDSQIKAYNLQENIGGAGGYNFGIKKAILDGADWVWVMDDDSIPDCYALEALVDNIDNNTDIGFLCSKVVWTDGKIHKMNIPKFPKPVHNNIESIDTTTPISAATFVSTIINAKAVYRVGLPIKEFFIWHDDIEYTERIISAGFRGVYCPSSIVVHKTAENYSPSIEDAPVSVAWKFYYQARNITVTKKLHKSKLSYLLSTINLYRLYLRHINKRKTDREIFRSAISKGIKDAIWFHPHIEFIGPTSHR
ncbi:MAG: glycosyltransferase family 2 protein [Muribaculaceae bacterium]|nr:glycosyltransferase family 2 protein [Muribaculaceae bacterium]